MSGTVAGVKVPIACTLTVDEQPTRLDEWRAAFRTSVAAAERESPTVLALRLRDDRAGLDALVDLVQRESACCAFFDFALRITAGAVTLVVTVPDDTAPILDDFSRLGS